MIIFIKNTINMYTHTHIKPTRFALTNRFDAFIVKFLRTKRDIFRSKKFIMRVSLSSSPKGAVYFDMMIKVISTKVEHIRMNECQTRKCFNDNIVVIRFVFSTYHFVSYDYSLVNLLTLH